MRIIFLLSTVTLPASAATVLTENDFGDFSDNHQVPTVFSLQPGVNTLSFVIGGGPVQGGGATNGSDADIVLFQLPPASTLTSLLVSTSEGGRHFFAAEFGNQFSVRPADSDAFENSLDAQFVFGQGSELVLRFQEDPTENFVALFQETGATRDAVTIQATLVPEPSTGMLMIIGSLPFIRRRRKRK